MIRFLLKSAFWLSLAFIVMPRFMPAEKENTTAEKPTITQATKAPDTVDQLLSNGKTAIEIGKLCMDNPSFCEKGTSLLSSAGSGLIKGSGQMLDYLSQRFGTQKEARIEPKPEAPFVAEPVSVQGGVPVPTSRADALRALEHSSQK